MMKKIGCVLLAIVGLPIVGYTLAVIVGAFLIAVGVIHPFGKPMIDNMDDPGFRQMVERRIGIDFPDSVQWQHSYYTAWQDCWFCCKFRIPESDIKPMLAPLQGEWYENDLSEIETTPSSLDWMNTEELSHTKAFHRTKVGYELDVVLDMDSRDESDCLTVYLSYMDY